MRLRPCLAMSKSESDKGVDVRQLTVTHGGSSKNGGIIESLLQSVLDRLIWMIWVYDRFRKASVD